MKSGRRLAFALACSLLWAVGAFGAHMFGIWLSLGGTAVVLGVVVLWARPQLALELLRPSVVKVAVGAVAGALMVAATTPLYAFVARAAPSVTSDVDHLYAAFREPSPPVRWLLLGPVILGEELVWRAVVQGTMQERMAAWPAATITALAYAAAHGPLGSPALVLAAFGCGLVWSGLRAATRSIVPSLVSHVIWDVMVLIAIPLQHGGAFR